MDDKKYWVGFNLIKGLGAVRMQGLAAYFGDLQTVWGADPASLAEAGLGAKVTEPVLVARQKVNLDQVWRKIESQGIKVLTWQDEAYPSRLKEIDQPPPVMYIRGEYLPDDLFNDIMQALDFTRTGEHKAARKVIPADETDSKLLNVPGGEPLHVDGIRNQADLPIERVSATLALMELKGMVRQVGGMNYVAVREEQGNCQAGTETGKHVDNRARKHEGLCTCIPVY